MGQATKMGPTKSSVRLLETRVLIQKNLRGKSGTLGLPREPEILVFIFEGLKIMGQGE